VGGIGPEKIILLLIVVLVLFGARRIPEIGASLGKGIREFKNSLSDSGSAGPANEIRPPQPRDAVQKDATDDRGDPKRLLG